MYDQICKKKKAITRKLLYQWRIGFFSIKGMEAIKTISNNRVTTF